MCVHFQKILLNIFECERRIFCTSDGRRRRARRHTYLACVSSVIGHRVVIMNIRLSRRRDRPEVRSLSSEPPCTFVKSSCTMHRDCPLLSDAPRLLGPALY